MGADEIGISPNKRFSTSGSARVAEQPRDAFDASIVTLPGIRLPVDARSLALRILAVLASIFALSWAQSFVVPLLLGIVIAYTLNPLVTWLEAIKIPRVVGSVLVMTTVMGALVLATYSLRGQMQTIIEQLPEAATKFTAGLSRMRIGPGGNMQIVQNAANEVERATTEAAGGSVTRRGPATHVIVDKPTFKLGNFLWESSMGALGVIGQAAMVLFLIFFLLLGGDTFKRKLVRLTGPSLSKRKITVHILDDINGSIQKYMLMLLTTNLLVALLCWFAFHWTVPRFREAVRGLCLSDLVLPARPNRFRSTSHRSSRWRLRRSSAGKPK